MTERNTPEGGGIRGILRRSTRPFAGVPLLGWLIAILIPVLLENGLPWPVVIDGIGSSLARVLGMSKVPALFGVLLILDKPAQIPNALLYVLIIYLIPALLIAWLGREIFNRSSAWLAERSSVISILIHIALLFAVLGIWTSGSPYRDLVARLTLIAIITTLSLNLVNGYMGEFSCSHPGFMALGAYTASVFTVVLFVQDNRFGAPLLPPALGPFLFPIALIMGGVVAALGALLVAIPSFRTRGDYLAIISLAFMFIVKSLFENLEVVGGARGISDQPKFASLGIVFLWTMFSIWVMNNFVRSTVGKALNAVRDDELAASAMTVNTRRTKMIAFLFAAFWAGVSGGLFAHVISYINPDTFGIRKLAEVLAMVYFGGLNSVTGSVVGAVGLSLIGEALRPLELYKWIIIPIILILIMIFRPTGLVAFTELDPVRLIQPRKKQGEEVDHGAA